jgi:hypothetical protein
MILFHPATIGTIAWVIGTVVLIIVFAGRTVSAVWGISSGVAKGVLGWSRRSETDLPPVSPAAVELPPLPTAGVASAPRLPRVINAGAAAQWRVPDVEVEDLPRRSLD